MKKKKKIILGSLILLVLTVVIYKIVKSDHTIVIEAKTVTSVKSSVTTLVTATGTIEPITQVEVGTQVSGVVEKIYVDYNSEVKQGQLIAELDKTNLKASKIQAQAAYDNAVSQRNYTKIIYERQKTLYENQVISKSDFDDAAYNYETSKGNVTQRYSDLQSAITNLSYANIYSPIDGVVLSRSIDEGQTVAASYSTPTLFTIAQDLKEMQVEADVDEADIGQVKMGQRVDFTVDAYMGETFKGIVTQVRLDPTVTSNVVTYTVVIKAENPDMKLKPGLTATISIYTLELKDVLTVEAKAVNFKPDVEMLRLYNEQHNLPSNPKSGNRKGNKEGNKEGNRERNKEGKGNSTETALWIYKKNGSISQKAVKFGASDGVNVQIISGINPGEKLVYSLKGMVELEEKPSGTSESPFMPKRPGGGNKK